MQRAALHRPRGYDRRRLDAGMVPARLLIGQAVSCSSMSSNARCKLVRGVAVAAMVAVGALSAYGAATLINRWVGVLVVSAIAFGSAPDFEMRVLAAIATGFACLATTLPPIIMLLPGGAAGFMLIFRTGRLLEWLYPPLGRPPESS